MSERRGKCGGREERRSRQSAQLLARLLASEAALGIFRCESEGSGPT
jgi:hypothetical protein